MMHHASKQQYPTKAFKPNEKVTDLIMIIAALRQKEGFIFEIFVICGNPVGGIDKSIKGVI